MSRAINLVYVNTAAFVSLRLWEDEMVPSAVESDGQWTMGIVRIIGLELISIRGFADTEEQHGVVDGQRRDIHYVNNGWAAISRSQRQHPCLASPA